jgi:anti-anti-sigma regulatory factor
VQASRDDEFFPSILGVEDCHCIAWGEVRSFIDDMTSMDCLTSVFPLPQYPMNPQLTTPDEFIPDFPSPMSDTVVLQPQSLVGHLGQTFYQELDDAIANSSHIIIDLLWIETWEIETLTSLVNAFLKAQSHGNPLTFLGMDPATRRKFDHGVQQGYQTDRMGSYGIFAPDFEAFLEQHHQVKSAAALR